jgi:Kef-type K+ transport system membrane component KefB
VAQDAPARYLSPKSEHQRKQTPVESGPNINVIVTALAMVVAAGVPALVPRLPLPGVVLEILLGVLLGPQLLGLIHPGGTLNALAGFGLAMVLLMAGFEIEPAVLRGKPVRLALIGWAVSCVLSFGAALLLFRLGLITAWAFTGLVLTTTAIGVLLPILRDGHLLAPPYGPLILAIGAAGEAGPIVLLSLLLAGDEAPLQALVMLGFAAAVVAVMVLASHASDGRLGTLVAGTIHTSGQLPMRLLLFLLVLCAVLSQALHIETVLGAFVAGAVARAALQQHHHESFGARLDGVGSAFLVPIFFIVSGTRLDLLGLVSHPATMILVPLYAALMLLTRGVPALLLYRQVLPDRLRAGLALHSGTQLSLVVAITGIAVEEHLMPPNQATALVFGGILTVILFPSLARGFLQDSAGTLRHGAPIG